MSAPEPGTVQCPAPGLRCILAPNPSAMTLHGTNSYILGEGAVAVIDPGPDDPDHLNALEAALRPGERISHVLVTHAHLDHSALARTLGERHGAPILAYGNAQAGRSRTMQALAEGRTLDGGEGTDRAFVPDRKLADDERLDGDGWSLRAIWTPGHMGNHMCFLWEELLFSGDHVMGWATSMISPPDGDMGAYMASLDRIATQGAERMFPGHGPPIEMPSERIAWLIAHRRKRELQILETLGPTPQRADEIACQIYVDIAPVLMPAAARNILAHLIDLSERGLARAEAPGPLAGFTLAGTGATAR